MSELTLTKLFAPATLGVAASTLYTVLAPNILRNAVVRVNNTSASTRLVTLYAVPSGDAAATANEFVSAKSIGPNDSKLYTVPILAVGDTLQGLADAAAVLIVHDETGVLWAQ